MHGRSKLLVGLSVQVRVRVRVRDGKWILFVLFFLVTNATCSVVLRLSRD